MEPERRLFPGFVAVLLALVGVFSPRNGTKHTKHTHDRMLSEDGAARLAYALGLLLAFDVSLGFNGIVYRGLYDYFVRWRIRSISTTRLSGSIWSTATAGSSRRRT